MNGLLRQGSQRTCSDWILRGFSLYCGEEFELVVTLSSARPAFPLASPHDTVSDRSVKGISQNHNCYGWRGQHLLERLNKVRAMNSSYSLRSSSIDGQRRTILTVSSENYVFQKTWSLRGLLAGWYDTRILLLTLAVFLTFSFFSYEIIEILSLYFL